MQEYPYPAQEYDAQDNNAYNMDPLQASLMQSAPIPPPYDWEAARLERKHEREQRAVKMAKHANLMTQYDKDYISRIQLSQFMNSVSDPSQEDFYYKTYQTLHNTSTPTEPNKHKGKPEAVNRMQQQMKRIIKESQKKKDQQTTTTTAESEGSTLGKMAQASTRNPKKALQIIAKTSQTSPPDSAGASPNIDMPKYDATRTPNAAIKSNAALTQHQHKRILQQIEAVYDSVLLTEQLAQNRPRQDKANQDKDQADKVMEWTREIDAAVKSTWERLEVEDISSLHPIHPLIRFLSYSKGKKIIPRALRTQRPERILNFITVIIHNFEMLDVCKNGIYPVKGQLSQSVLDEVDLFLGTVMPPIMSYVNDAPLPIANGLLALFMDRCNVAWVARSKVGLIMLTILLSRIETLRQSQAPPLSPEQEIQITQSIELFNLLFTMLHKHLATIFPPPSSHQDDMHVWQFLASLSIGLVLEHQQELVKQVREKVMETLDSVSKGNVSQDIVNTKISNVNLFLHAIGLDASQVMATQVQA
jgi:DNA topoisomerase 2-associated protein PAT1